jgi:hypothetical protein
MICFGHPFTPPLKRLPLTILVEPSGVHLYSHLAAVQDTLNCHNAYTAWIPKVDHNTPSMAFRLGRDRTRWMVRSANPSEGNADKQDRSERPRLART